MSRMQHAAGSAAPVGPVGAVDASTLLLLRDGPTSPEVLVLERHLDMDFPGALVFPGGKVEAADRTLDPSCWRGVDPVAWSARLGVADPADALGLLVAAVRETFEECAVLLARGTDGRPVDPALLDRADVVEARRRLASGDDGITWEGFLREHGLVLELGALALWSWWVTPVGPPRRYDTRFFVAPFPPGQVPVVDGGEATTSRFASADDLLAVHASGEAQVVFPTRHNLRALAGFRTVDEVRDAAARDALDRSRIEPTLVRVDGRVLVQHPAGGEPEPL